MPSEADQIWNRATALSSSDAARVGDVALADLLLFHGRAMNGGLDHAIDTLSSEELAASAQGYSYFGLLEVAAVLRRTILEPEVISQLEVEYDRAVPNDNALFQAFEAKFLSSPDDFCPLLAA